MKLHRRLAVPAGLQQVPVQVLDEDERPRGGVQEQRAEVVAGGEEEERPVAGGGEEERPVAGIEEERPVAGGGEERPVAGGGEEERPVAGGEEEELEAVEPAQARRGAGGGGLRGCCAGRRPRPRRGQLARMPWLPGRLALHASARPRRLCTAGHGDAQARRRPDWVENMASPH